MKYEIDVAKIIHRLIRYIWVIILAFIIGAVSGYLYTSLYKSDTYTAVTRLIIRNQQSEEISQTQLAASEQLVATCVSILQSDTVIQEDVVNVTGLPYTKAQIRAMTSMSAVDDTQVLCISVTSSSPEDSAAIARAFADYGSQTVVEKLGGGYISILDEASVPKSPNSKGETRNAAVFGLLLALVCAGVIAVITMFDTRISSEEDLAEIRADVPIIGIIPSFSQRSDGYYGKYGYESYGKSGGKE